MTYTKADQRRHRRWMLALYRGDEETYERTGWRKYKLRGCTAHECGLMANRKHGRCVRCDNITCDRSFLTDPDSQRRRLTFVCSGCYSTELHWRRYGGEQATRKMRTLADWRRVTDPVERWRLRFGEFPEQFPSATRATLRAFMESSDDFAVVPAIKAGSLNQSIAAIGLEDEMYAEQRGNQTVVRRIGGAS